MHLTSQRKPESIPTGLIVTGPNIASQELLFSQLAQRIKKESDGHSIVVNLRSGDAPNLKASLKKIIRDATNEEHDEEDSRLPASPNEAQKLLNYDLQILHNYLGTSTCRQVIIAFQDSEAFDSSLLIDLVLLFKSWLDRIPIAILFGVATSVELFHERLSRSAIMCLQGAQFDVENTTTTLEKIFEAVIFDEDATLRFGPNFLGSLLERQQDHVQSLQAFIAALKYAYMTHFYANPLSIFLGPPPNSPTWASRADAPNMPLSQPEHVEAIRMLPSFRADMEKSLKEGHTDEVRECMEDDISVLISYADNKLPFAQAFAQVKKFKPLNEALELVAPNAREGEIELYINFTAQTINDSAVISELVAGCKRLTPSSAVHLCQTVLENQLRRAGITSAPRNFQQVQFSNRAYMNIEEEDQQQFIMGLHNLLLKFDDVLEKDFDASKPIRSIYTQQAQTLRTTIGKGQRVQLEKADAKLSKEDSNFTCLIDELVGVMKGYFAFESPFLPGHEICIYDSKSPFRETFTPRPRHAIERALSAPHDYLGCDCCRGSGGLSASQPPTAILYQLYLETGVLINVFDLWSAFKTIVSGDNEGEEEERRTLALFYQALADLKMIGAVKMSRRKTDHLGKLAWKGL